MAVKDGLPGPQYTAGGDVQAFLQPTFDPVDYLNSTLPPLSTASRPVQGTQYGRPVPLPELSTQLQSMLAQLNAQTTRLSNTLTQLTDEIIRSGGRLAYEVEVLRGDTIGLTDALDSGLRKDVELFTSHVNAETDEEGTVGEPEKAADPIDSPVTAEPEYLERLRTLTEVRSRLDSVIKVFGDAMAWPLAPSELSSSSSLISVSAPESDGDSRSREEKGKEYAEKLHMEINDLIGTGNDVASLEAAAIRIEHLKQLADVWKGTAEEKARLKLVESLQKPVEERQRALEKTGQARKPGVSPVRAVDYRYGDVNGPRAGSEGGYGFLQNLRNLKNEMYLE